jgi:uncharacterized protein with PQ loop repeat
MDSQTAVEFAAILFTLLNGVRLLAYLPQILKIAHDRRGAEAISCLSWLLFALSHLSTALYAMLVITDSRMMWLFAANFLACVAILALTALKRAQLTNRREVKLTEEQG